MFDGRVRQLGALSRSHDQVDTDRQFVAALAEDFADGSLPSIPRYGIADFTSYAQSKACDVEAVGSCLNDQDLVSGINGTVVDGVKIRLASYSRLFGKALVHRSPRDFGSRVRLIQLRDKIIEGLLLLIVQRLRHCDFQFDQQISSGLSRWFDSHPLKTKGLP